MKIQQPNEFPKDVQAILEYTRLRKKHPRPDKELRLSYGFDKKSINMYQMYHLLMELKKHDSRRKRK